eukprot:gnl/TRDRNA2_/TRDRNA2_38172_c0_seq1.p3 gnl/TRDRNA2_/TRDRNA2_38172_c0~~gnl/TRDRNA2_/TRDRNA2_38172_c0_seq1.p3  ORF type:complete len:107 (+),score=33.49 gnl/TRDRNA2_/TRDRNA2_38172_c0_seq1:94-414(+)
MVYLEDFDEFVEATKSLFVEQPLRTRYLSKYRHVDNKLILKVTNDRVCFKYKTDQIADLKRIEKFTQSFIRWTVTKNLDNIDEPDAELEDAKEAAKPQAKRKRRKG